MPVGGTILFVLPCPAMMLQIGVHDTKFLPLSSVLNTFSEFVLSNTY